LWAWPAKETRYSRPTTLVAVVVDTDGSRVIVPTPPVDTVVE